VTPFLSIVITARNDDYGGDFRGRFLQTLRFNHRELSHRGIDHEFVLVEWAPYPDRVLLADVVAEEIPEMDSATLLVVAVDAAYQDALSQNPRLRYLEFAAKNVGIRRAGGRFLLLTNCDTCLGRRVLEVLSARALEPRTLYRAARHDLERGLIARPLDWSALEDPANLDGPAPPPLRPPLMPGGTGDFMLLDAESWRELRGFDEVYRLATLGMDAAFLVKAHDAGIRIADIGGPVYHVNHGNSFRTSRAAFADAKQRIPWLNKRTGRGVVYDNPDTWGLRDAPAREIGPRRWRLDFDWNAVPPLVDLHRLRLPPRVAQSESSSP
jgi:hypothetical protein